MTAAIMTKAITAFRNAPYRKMLPLIVNCSAVKSCLPPMAAIKGVTRSATNPFTTAVNAAPITMPTARSTTFPRSRNSLNSFIAMFASYEWRRPTWRDYDAAFLALQCDCNVTRERAARLYRYDLTGLGDYSVPHGRGGWR